MENNQKVFVDKIINWAGEKKAEDVKHIEVSDRCSFTDHLIICNGSNELHVKAIAQHIIDQAEKEQYQILSAEGLENANWVLLDFIDIIVHIFLTGKRAYYRLEDLWEISPREREITGKNDDQAENNN